MSLGMGAQIFSEAKDSGCRCPAVSFEGTVMPFCLLNALMASFSSKWAAIFIFQLSRGSPNLLCSHKDVLFAGIWNKKLFSSYFLSWFVFKTFKLLKWFPIKMFQEGYFWLTSPTFTDTSASQFVCKRCKDVNQNWYRHICILCAHTERGECL